MKFSEMASNQSARAVPSSTRGKCFVRSPMPWPREGNAAPMEREERGGLPPAPLHHFPSTTLPPFLAQSSLLVSTQPWPLHAFLPAQPCPAPEHSPCPLHALIPAQCTMSPPVFCSAARARTAPPRIRLAAALATSIPFVFFICSSLSRRPAGFRPRG